MGNRCRENPGRGILLFLVLKCTGFWGASDDGKGPPLPYQAEMGPCHRLTDWLRVQVDPDLEIRKSQGRKRASSPRYPCFAV